MSPLYYASGEKITKFELEGRNLNLIPVNSVGYLSTNNNNPADHLGSSSKDFIGDITEISYGRLVITMRVVTNHEANYYLGVIANETTKEIYWINNTRPLP